jgi:hypothetical protein
LGFTGQKMGRPIDVYRRAGMPTPLASVLDFSLTTSPLKVLQVAKKSFGSLSKLSDKGIEMAGQSLVKATEEAKRVTGIQLETAYKAVDNIKINSKVFGSLLNRIPKTLKGEVEKLIGKDIFTNPTVANARKLKQLVGKYKPGVFGKEERGLAENIEGEQLNKLYSQIKSVIDGAVEQGAGKKVAQGLSKMDTAFSDVSHASDYVQKTIIDPTLVMATKGGSMAKKIALEGDTTGRRALNILKSSGARKEINKAVDALTAFNQWQSVAQFGQHAANAALFGGAVGSMGGLVASRLYNRGQE